MRDSAERPSVNLRGAESSLGVLGASYSFGDSPPSVSVDSAAGAAALLDACEAPLLRRGSQSTMRDAAVLGGGD